LSTSGGKPRVVSKLPEPVDREDEHDAVETEHEQDRSVEVVLKKNGKSLFFLVAFFNVYLF